MLIGTLGASLLENLWTSTRLKAKIVEQGVMRAEKVTIRAFQDL